MSNDNPLQKLIVDEVALDKEKLTSLISGNLGISKSGDIVILPGFNSLNTKSKILSILLAKKAAKLLQLTDNEKASLRDLIQKTGFPQGTVGRELSELKAARLVLSENGYYIPDYATHQISLQSGNTTSGNSKRSSRKSHRQTHTQTNITDINKSDKTDLLLQIKQESITPELIELMIKPGLYIERSLAVLKIARDNGIEDLTPAEIETFLKSKIRAGAIRKSNISLYLGTRGTRYVDRFPDAAGNGFTYRIMLLGEKLLEEALKKHGKNQTLYTPVEESPKINEQEPKAEE